MNIDNLSAEFKNLLSEFSSKKGVFFEAGANDGLEQSYTAILEKQFGWTGVLAEPSVTAFEKCKKNRPLSRCINSALVSDSSIETVLGDFDGSLMSSVNGKRRGNSNLIEVPATTLEKIFDEFFNSTHVDFISIDVENYELDVLTGMNFKKYQPTYILIEIYSETFTQVNDLLINNGYSLISNVTGFSHETHPYWDGTHNDYLYKYS
jgi:FkbM family methyltransferase